MFFQKIDKKKLTRVYRLMCVYLVVMLFWLFFTWNYHLTSHPNLSAVGLITTLIGYILTLRLCLKISEVHRWQGIMFSLLMVLPMIPILTTVLKINSSEIYLFAGNVVQLIGLIFLYMHRTLQYFKIHKNLK
jgi:hypothetical protein